MKLRHICEVCGRKEDLTSEEAFYAGWDYPPRMGQFGIVGPRTCPDCPINRTVWWAIAIERNQELDLLQLATVERILGEPETIQQVVDA